MINSETVFWIYANVVCEFKRVLRAVCRVAASLAMKKNVKEQACMQLVFLIMFPQSYALLSRDQSYLWTCGDL